MNPETVKTVEHILVGFFALLAAVASARALYLKAKFDAQAVEVTNETKLDEATQAQLLEAWKLERAEVHAERAELVRERAESRREREQHRAELALERAAAKADRLAAEAAQREAASNLEVAENAIHANAACQERLAKLENEHRLCPGMIAAAQSQLSAQAAKIATLEMDVSLLQYQRDTERPSS